jgi:hypothetical protein
VEGAKGDGSRPPSRRWKGRGRRRKLGQFSDSHRNVVVDERLGLGHVIGNQSLRHAATALSGSQPRNTGSASVVPSGERPSWTMISLSSGNAGLSSSARYSPLLLVLDDQDVPPLSGPMRTPILALGERKIRVALKPGSAHHYE